MSKGQQVNMLSDEDLPPPYSLGPSSSYSSSSIPATSFTSGDPQQDSSFIFSTQLSSLRGQLREEQAARSTARDQQDGHTLSLLVPYVEELLGSIARIHPPPKLVEATLVPEGAIGAEWSFSDSEEKRSGEVRKVIHVGQDLDFSGDKKQAPIPPVSTGSSSSSARDQYKFDEWGRWEDAGEGTTASEAQLWWSDEEMARRLAKHLQPNRATASVDRQTVRAQVERSKEAKKSGRWSRFKKDDLPAQAAQPTARSASATKSHQDDISMSVKAEEVTFRRQNEMGIWESRKGWGLVVRVGIRQ